MLDAAKNKLRVKVSYLMIALTVAGCIYMVIEGKKVRVGFCLATLSPKTEENGDWLVHLLCEWECTVLIYWL